MKDFVSIIDQLKKHADEYPHDIAIKFLNQKAYEAITYAELLYRVQVCAGRLQQTSHHEGERAVILLRPSLEYVIAFLGCLYAGVIAVPAYPPRKNQHAERVAAIIQDSQAIFVITHEELNGQFSDCQIITVEENSAIVPGKDFCISSDTVAFIQYTSGSTSDPKGVLITHANVISNLKKIHSTYPDPDSQNSVKACSWLPPYHDMGLIGGIMCPLYYKVELTLMLPTHFLRSPLSWLNMISEEQINVTVAPNFAFDMCTNIQEPTHHLNLTSLQCIYNGSEPIQYNSLKNFCERFASVGFNPSALYPCFGLAEATLMLTAKRLNKEQDALTLIKSDFDLGKISIAHGVQEQSTIQIVNCGTHPPDHSIRIVDPFNIILMPELTIGEIWASGPSIAQGYWNQPKKTEATFVTQDFGTGKASYLRTGDLGFMYQGNLYVTGRMHDRMVIRGKNYYPHDVELAASQSHPACEFHGAAAFTTDVDGEQKLILLQEIKRECLHYLNQANIFSAIRGALLEQGLSPNCIVLLKPYSLPKTSSGKVRRNAARIAFNEKTLKIIAYWEREQSQFNTFSYTFADIKFWLDDWLYQHLKMSLKVDDYDKSLVDLGLNSMTAVELTYDLQHKIGQQVDLLPLMEHSSLNQLISIVSDPKALALHKRQTAIAVTPASFSLDNTQVLHQTIGDIDLKAIYFNVNEGISSDTTYIGTQKYINYSGYNYLGLSGDPFVSEAVIEAVKTYGTSVSASRLVSGEKPLHGALEKAIASLIGTEDSLVFSSGYLTNLTIITHLLGKDDLIVCDALCHNSILQAARFSGAACVTYPHNNPQHIIDFLEKNRSRYQKVLLVTEGIFSMDGDIPDVRPLIAIKKQYDAMLMIDEAHSIGVLGHTGAGIREHFNLRAEDVDIWMGTLSKSFASCGGYIAGNKNLIHNFKYTSAGFVYSAGITPANTAASLAAIQVMKKEPERVQLLKKRHTLLLNLLKEAGVPTGLSQDTPIIPLIVKKDSLAIRLSHFLKQQGILALPIIYPAVEKNSARVRLFVNCLHSEAQIYETVRLLKIANLYKEAEVV